MHPTLKRTLRYFLKYWVLLVVSCVFSLIVGITDAGFAYLVEPALQRIFAGQDTSIFLLVPFGIIGLFVIRGVSRFIYDTSIKLAGQKAVQDIRDDFYRKTIRQDMAFFHNKSTGDLMSRMTNDITTMQEGLGQVVTGLFRDVISLVALLGVVFYRNWQLAMITFLVFPITIYPAQLIGKRIKKAAKKSLDVMGGLGSTMQESFSGIKVIKAFGLENTVVAKFKEENLRYLGQFFKFIKYESLATPVTELIISFGIAAVIYVGGHQVIAGRMTPSELFSFITAMVMLFTPLKKLQGSYNVIQRSAGAAERVFHTMDEQNVVVENPEAITLDRVEGAVDFKNVCFGYGEDLVVRDVSFRASPGQMVALVGPSGSGKSTIVSLLMRFYDVTSGQILLDGVDLRNVTLESLNKQFALVDQETTLFHDTIANNIRYGCPAASDDDVQAAAKAAYAHDFITDLPEGYQTSIGDRGLRLSGGQRQRLCIARAILRNAPILILDEATSALDTESEKMVQRALDNLVQNRTTFVIAHRLSTIQHADVIVVLEKGRVVEIGSHADLVEGQGIYHRLHSMQFSDTPDQVAVTV